MQCRPKTIDSKKLEYWPGAIYAGVPSSQGFMVWGTVILQLSGFQSTAYDWCIDTIRT